MSLNCEHTLVQIEGEPTAAQQMFNFLNAGDWSNARDCAMRALEQMNNLSRGAVPLSVPLYPSLALSLSVPLSRDSA